MTDDWPTGAREAVMQAIAACSADPIGHTLGLDDPALYEEEADAVLAALAPHLQPRTDDWEWGVRYRGGPVHFMASEAEALRSAAGTSRTIVVRRRPAGEWEVAP